MTMRSRIRSISEHELARLADSIMRRDGIPHGVIREMLDNPHTPRFIARHTNGGEFNRYLRRTSNKLGHNNPLASAIHVVVMEAHLLERRSHNATRSGDDHKTDTE